MLAYAAIELLIGVLRLILDRIFQGASKWPARI
jgi:hypothetical protein